MKCILRLLVGLFAVFILHLVVTGWTEPSDKENSDNPQPPETPPVRTSFKLRGRLNENLGRHILVAVSPDGKLAISAGDGLRVWSIPEAKLLRTIEIQPAKPDVGWVGPAVFFPDGKQLATISHRGPDFDVVHIFSVDGWKEVPHSIPNGHWVHLALSADGKKIALTGHSNVLVWDLQQSKTLHEFQRPKRFASMGLTVAFSPDGHYLAGGFSRNSEGIIPPELTPLLRVWDLRTGKEMLRGWAEAMHCKTVAFSPNGRLLAAGGEGGGSGLIQIWDMSSLKLLHRFPADGSLVNVLSFHSSGRVLASGGNDPTVKLWDVNKGTLIKELEGHVPQERGQAMYGMAFSKDGSTLLSASRDQQILIWEADGE